MSDSKVFEPAIALLDIVSILNKLQQRYFLVGSFASGFRGEFRATNDLDLVADFGAVDPQAFCQLAKDSFYCDEISIPEAIASHRSFNLIHESTFVKVDFFTKLSSFEEEQFGLSTLLKIPGTDIQARVSTAEYNIIAKINWYLKSDRVLERQLSDVRAMLVINRDSLDKQYLSRWARYFGIEKLLEEISAGVTTW